MSEVATTETEVKTEPINLHNLTDDEFMNIDPSELDGSSEEKTATEATSVDDDVDDTGGADATEDSIEAGSEGAVPTSEDLDVDLGDDDTD